VFFPDDKGVPFLAALAARRLALEAEMFPDMMLMKEKENKLISKKNKKKLLILLSFKKKCDVQFSHQSSFIGQAKYQSGLFCCGQ
jgi:hypothetical protein